MSCIVFAYSQLGHDCLKLLIDRGEEVLALFTHKDSSAEYIWFDSCADLAKRYSIPVYTPTVLDDQVFQIIQNLQPQLIFSFYYRNMIPESILDLAPLGAFNMHGSYLPKYQGRAPVNWAIIQGETETGVTLHYMVKAPDAGDIVDQEKVSIPFHATAGDVTNDLNKAAVQVLGRQLLNLKVGTAPRTPQDHTQATYFGGRKPDDGEVHFDKSSLDIYNLVRALLPVPQYPGAFGVINGKRFLFTKAKILEKADCLVPGTPLDVQDNCMTVSCGYDGSERIQLWTQALEK